MAAKKTSVVWWLLEVNQTVTIIWFNKLVITHNDVDVLNNIKNIYGFGDKTISNRSFFYTPIYNNELKLLNVVYGFLRLLFFSIVFLYINYDFKTSADVKNNRYREFISNSSLVKRDRY